MSDSGDGRKYDEIFDSLTKRGTDFLDEREAIKAVPQALEKVDYVRIWLDVLQTQLKCRAMVQLQMKESKLRRNDFAMMLHLVRQHCEKLIIVFPSVE